MARSLIDVLLSSSVIEAVPTFKDISICKRSIAHAPIIALSAACRIVMQGADLYNH